MSGEVRVRSACGDYFAEPDLTCGLVAGHDSPHSCVPSPDRRLFRWVRLPNGHAVHPDHPAARRHV